MSWFTLTFTVEEDVGARICNGMGIMERTLDNSLVICERGQNIVENRRGGRSAPTTVNSSVREGIPIGVLHLYRTVFNRGTLL